MLRSIWRKRLASLVVPGILVVAACAFAGSPGQPAPSQDSGKLVVHEWGTFLAVQGSDGKTLGGMIESEERLPNFVREQALGGRNRACLNCKMETPVTYFYVDKPRTVEVRVVMTEGQLTHWFPAAQSFGAEPAKGKSPGRATFLDWGKIELTPDVRSNSVGSHPPVPGLRPVAGDDTWGFVRETDAALVRVAPRSKPVIVRTPGEVEKFLFYRGVGSFDLPLQAVFNSEGRRVPALEVHNRGKEPLQGIFLIEVDTDSNRFAQHTIRFEAVPDLAGGGQAFLENRLAVKPRLPLSEGVPQVKKALEDALVHAGLYAKEARAMVNNWEKSYFRTGGLRILYVLPRSRVDEIIPIRISPTPDQLVRVMVGRLEVLTPGDERRLESAVAALNSSNAEARKVAQAQLTQLGRLQEPALRRVAEMTTDPAVRGRAESLIAKISAKK